MRYSRSERLRVQITAAIRARLELPEANRSGICAHDKKGVVFRQMLTSLQVPRHLRVSSRVIVMRYRLSKGVCNRHLVNNAHSEMCALENARPRQVVAPAHGRL